MVIHACRIRKNRKRFLHALPNGGIFHIPKNPLLADPFPLAREGFHRHVDKNFLACLPHSLCILCRAGGKGHNRRRKGDGKRKHFLCPCAAIAEIINQNSDVLLQLINDILDLSKIEAGTFEYIKQPMDLGEMCRNVYEIHKGRVQEGVTLTLDNENDSLMINEDKNRILQLITNLITNAIKFTYEGEIHFGFKLKKDYIDFYVKDTGIGISEEKLSHIFGRFVKLNSFVQGTGLGLAICQMIVEKMGGAITVESELHEGSTFRFTIPYDMYNKQEKFKKNAEREQHLKVAIKSLQLRTLLVAEDVDSNFLLMNTVLGKKYKLIRARDGREAVDMYKENHPDLIFMDIKMPYMDGLEATRLIRGYSKDIPIIALTAFAFESDREKAIEAGCNDYLTKPVSQEAIEKILDKYSL